MSDEDLREWELSDAYQAGWRHGFVSAALSVIAALLLFKVLS